MDRRKRRPPPRRRALPLAPSQLLKSALPLNKRPRKSAWDVCAKGYEHISVEQLKLSGEISQGAPVPSQVPPKLLQIVSIPELIPQKSVMMRMVCCDSGSGEIGEYLAKFGPIDGSDGRWVLSSPEAAAKVLATPGPFEFKRPERVVSSLQGDIYTNTDTWYGPPDATPADETVLLDGGQLYLRPQSTEGLKPLFDRRYGQPILSKQLDRMAKQAIDKTTAPPSLMLQIFNAVPLTDPTSAPKICEEITDRCKVYGQVESAKFIEQSDMLSYIQVQFSTEDACRQALAELGSLEFDGRPLICAPK